MAIWPDPAHGTRPYGYLKISWLTFRKVNMFEHVETIDYTLLEIYLLCWFQGLPAGCVCVWAACGASTTSETKTRTWILEHVFCGCCDFKTILRSPGQIFTIWPICSNDYASKTHIEILCKQMCCMAPHVFYKLDFLLVPGMIEPWPECQPDTCVRKRIIDVQCYGFTYEEILHWELLRFGQQP